MAYEPKFSDTALIRMKQFDLAQWQVLRAFESSDKKYTEDGAILGRATVDDKLITALYRQLDDGGYIVITVWAKSIAELDEKYRQKYGKWPKR